MFHANLFFTLSNDNMSKADTMSKSTQRLAPPDQLRKKYRTIADLAVALKISRFQTYGLLSPGRYPLPSGLFDVRDDLAHRVAEVIGATPESVRDYYEKAAA